MYNDLKKPGSSSTYKQDFIDHIVNTLEGVHNDRVAEYRAADVRARQGGKGGRNTVYNRIAGQYIDKNDIDSMNDLITKGEYFVGYDGADYIPNGDGTYRRVDPSSGKVLEKRVTKKQARAKNAIDVNYKGEEDTPTTTQTMSFQTYDPTRPTFDQPRTEYVTKLKESEK